MSEDTPDEPDEWSVQDYEDQEWDVGGDKQQDIEYTFIDGTTKRFLVQDPDPEVIIDFVAVEPGEDPDTATDLYELVSASVVAPEITLDRWRQLRTPDKLGLGDAVADAIGLNEILGFPDGGVEQLTDG